MYLADIRWRNWLALLVAWGIVTFWFVTFATAYARDLSGLGPNEALRGTTVLFEGMPLPVKGALLALSSLLFVGGTAALAAQLLKGRSAAVWHPYAARFLYIFSPFGIVVLLFLAALRNPAQVFFLLALLGLLFILQQYWQYVQTRQPVPALTDQPPSLPLAQMLSRKSRFQLALAGLFIVYLGGALLIPLRVQPDSLSYLQIAREYANGEWVVRGHWSPLISWLMAPFITGGLGPDQAARLVLIAIGAGLLAGIRRLAVVFDLNPTGQWLAMGLGLGLAWESLASPNADSLSAMLLVWLWAYSLDTRLSTHPYRYGLILGALGGAAYLAKAYNFAALVVYWPVWGGLLWMHGRSLKPLLKAAGVALLVMVIVAAPWVAALESRYGVVSLSSASHLTGANQAPDATGWMVCNDGRRLCPEPDDVLFPWQDHLAKYQPNTGWNRLASWADFSYSILLFAFNVTVLYIINLSVFSVLIVLLLLAGLVFWQDRQRRLRYGWLCMMSVVYPSGYMLVNATPARYFFPLLAIYCVGAILLAWDAWRMAQPIWQPNQNNRTLQLGSVALLLFLVMGGVFSLLHYNPETLDPYCHSLAEDAPELSRPVVSIEPHSYWNRVQDVAFYTQTRTYGSLAPDFYSVAEMVEQFEAHAVKTVLVSSELPDIHDQLVNEYGYRSGGTLESCRFTFSILYPPAALPRIGALGPARLIVGSG